MSSSGAKTERESEVRLGLDSLQRKKQGSRSELGSPKASSQRDPVTPWLKDANEFEEPKGVAGSDDEGTVAPEDSRSQVGKVAKSKASRKQSRATGRVTEGPLPERPKLGYKSASAVKARKIRETSRTSNKGSLARAREAGPDAVSGEKLSIDTFRPEEELSRPASEARSGDRKILPEDIVDSQGEGEDPGDPTDKEKGEKKRHRKRCTTEVRQKVGRETKTWNIDANTGTYLGSDRVKEEETEVMERKRYHKHRTKPTDEAGENSGKSRSGSGYKLKERKYSEETSRSTSGIFVSRDGQRVGVRKDREYSATEVVSKHRRPSDRRG